MKGIVLAAGEARALRPATLAVPKPLLPIYDKPMIYHPISTLMLAGVREMLIVTTPAARPQFEACLGDGAQFGLALSYAEQAEARGVADGLLVGESFVDGAPCAMILGDNIFFGAQLHDNLQDVATLSRGARVFASRVRRPELYGVVEFDAAGAVRALEEKPVAPCSDWALTGLYFYDGRACQIARGVRPSARGLLEITDVNAAYHREGGLDVRRLGRGEAWLDTRTHDALSEAAGFIRALQHRQGLKIACLEEIAHANGWLSTAELEARGRALAKTDYGRYLLHVAEGAA